MFTSDIQALFNTERFPKTAKEKTLFTFETRKNSFKCKLDLHGQRSVRHEKKTYQKIQTLLEAQPELLQSEPVLTAHLVNYLCEGLSFQVIDNYKNASLKTDQVSGLACNLEQIKDPEIVNQVLVFYALDTRNEIPYRVQCNLASKPAVIEYKLLTS